MYYSPLRYPGGKAKLAPFMAYMTEKLHHIDGIYIEPFAGGAGIAVELLERGIVQSIVLNDFDKGIYSFWRAILTETDRFIEDLYDVPLTMDEWRRQHQICLINNKRYSYQLGFATFYMNRTNRSGIIKGGVIGGVKQDGKWKLDARFHREHLAERILSIAKRKKNITIYNKDVRSFITRYLPQYQNNSLVYFDPPYFQKGKQLYLNFFNTDDHVKIKESIIEHVNCNWIITYDNAPEIQQLYADQEIKCYDLDYSASTRKKASELIIFDSSINLPTNDELIENNIHINFRDCF